MLMRRGFIVTMTLLLALNSAFAQDEDEPSEDPRAMPQELAQELDRESTLVQRKRAELERLEQRLGREEGVVRTVIEARANRQRVDLFEGAQAFAIQVADLVDEGYDLSNYRDEAISRLQALPEFIHLALARVREGLVFATQDMSAADQAVLDAQFAEAAQANDRMSRALLRNLQISERLGIDIAREQEKLRTAMADRAANGSIYLELTIGQVKELRARLSIIPNDDELTAKLNVTQGRVRTIAGELNRALDTMRLLDMDTSSYQQQVIAATGEITTEILDIEVLGGLFSRAGKSVAKWVQQNGGQLFLKLLLFLGILLIFRLLAKLAQRLVERGLKSSRVTMSQLLQRTIVSTTRNLVFIFGVLFALSQLGISIGPLLAGLGVAGFILGFALQDTISNFFSGLMILMYRPFDEGDVVEIAGAFGTVSDMSLVNTTVLTFDNQTLIVPNNKIWGDVIKNVTHQRTRRVDLAFRISYGDDVPKAERVLRDIVTSHDKVLADPEPTVRLHELDDSSMNFIVRPWVNTGDYWDVYWDITREVKMRFDAEGITIPFPQRDVHLPPPTE
ncbi:MAG: mechanosensitive ion channel [Gammaproteobacteria bacterium]|nr:mechanosensitive ion channel [Gammaproteobacteria bacterium]